MICLNLSQSLLLLTTTTSFGSFIHRENKVVEKKKVKIKKVKSNLNVSVIVVEVCTVWPARAHMCK